MISENKLNDLNISEEELNYISILITLQDHYYDVMRFSAGGPLHIVLDDYNLEDGPIKYCKEICVKINDVIGIMICNVLLEISLELREIVFENQWYFKELLEKHYELLHARLTEHYNKK